MNITKIKDSNEVYHDPKSEYISRSQLFKMSKSPAHFKYYKENPPEQTPALLFGAAFHSLVLEPEDFAEKYYVITEPLDMRTRAGKELAVQIKESGKQIINNADYQRMKGMYESIYDNENVCRLLEGEHETSYYWTDKTTGVKLKCRPDCRTDYNTEISVIVDLKTTADASFEAFTRSCIKYGYDLQAAMYTEGVQLYENKPHKFVFIAVEKEPPYAVNIIDFDDVFFGEEKGILHGLDKFREYVGMVAECNFTGIWYDYRGSLKSPGTISLPTWMYDKER